MGHRSRACTRIFALLVALVAAFALPEVGAASGHGDQPVPLTLWNVAVRPGRPYVISIRTCQPRGISQGQILIRRPNRPVPEVRRAHVFSYENDGSIQASAVEATSLLSTFTSAEAAINERHGPFLALLMRSEIDLAPGDVLPLSVEADSTFLMDGDLEPSPFITLDATITVLEPDAPFLLEATNLMKGTELESAAGEEVVLSIGTREFLPLSRAEIVLRYDPDLFATITVSDLWDYRQDLGSVVDLSEPGVLRLDLASPSGSLNLLPGPMIEFEMVPHEGAIVGTTTPLAFDRDATIVVDKRGRALDLDLRDAVYTVIEGLPEE